MSIEDRKQKIREVLCSKAKEYATDDNRFHNFDEAARLLKCEPTMALRGMLVKHWVSIMDLVRPVAIVTPELINEKIGDAINYLILWDGLLCRKIYDFNTLVDRHIARLGIRDRFDIATITEDLEYLWTALPSTIPMVIDYLATLEQHLYREVC